MLFLFKESGTPVTLKVNYKDEYKNFFKAFLELLKIPGVGRFLLAFFLFNDAILTMENNFAIYLQQVFNISDTVKSLLLLGVLVTATIGAFVSGWLGDKIGLKKSLMFILIVTAILFPAMGLANNFTVFTILSVITGLVYGASWTVARAILAYLTPATHVNHTFSYYSLVERFATFVGPLAWGLTILFLNHYGALRYRAAIIVLDVFIVLGAIIVSKIPSDKKEMSLNVNYAASSQ